MSHREKFVALSEVCNNTTLHRNVLIEKLHQIGNVHSTSTSQKNFPFFMFILS